MRWDCILPKTCRAAEGTTGSPAHSYSLEAMGNLCYQKLDSRETDRRRS